MKKELAEVLAEYLNAEVREDYSGRSMYGNETYAVTGDFGPGELMEAVAEIAYDAGVNEDEDFSPSDFRFRQDSMGLGTVIY